VTYNADGMILGRAEHRHHTHCINSNILSYPLTPPHPHPTLAIYIDKSAPITTSSKCEACVEKQPVFAASGCTAYAMSLCQDPHELYTPVPSTSPTVHPTVQPTAAPTVNPTTAPSTRPTDSTNSPTTTPSAALTEPPAPTPPPPPTPKGLFHAISPFDGY
jgi:hypothetical protein